MINGSITQVLPRVSGDQHESLLRSLESANHPDLRIDLANYRIIRSDGTTANLTPQEHRVLSALLSAGRVMTYAELAERAWGHEQGYSPACISACVCRLRLKLGDKDRIENVRGVGYRLDSLLECKLSS